MTQSSPGFRQINRGAGVVLMRRGWWKAQLGRAVCPRAWGLLWPRACGHNPVNTVQFSRSWEKWPKVPMNPELPRRA